MALTVGIFERERQVLDGARRLLDAGRGIGGMRALVRNEEGAPLLSSQSELPVEGIALLRETGEREARGDWDYEPGERFVPSAAVLVSLQGAGTPGQVAPVAAMGLAGMGGGLRTEAYLDELGFPSGLSSVCAEELNAGRFLLLAETADGDEEAASLLRAAGALDVLQ